MLLTACCDGLAPTHHAHLAELTQVDPEHPTLIP